MQRMSRAQKFLLVYILLELQKPRVIQKITRHYSGGIGKHGNDMHTQTFSTVTDHGALSGLNDSADHPYDGSRIIAAGVRHRRRRHLDGTNGLCVRLRAAVCHADHAGAAAEFVSDRR